VLERNEKTREGRVLELASDEAKVPALTRSGKAEAFPTVGV
jgi:hypothetical protein